MSGDAMGDQRSMAAMQRRQDWVDFEIPLLEELSSPRSRPRELASTIARERFESTSAIVLADLVGEDLSFVARAPVGSDAEGRRDRHVNGRSGRANAKHW